MKQSKANSRTNNGRQEPMTMAMPMLMMMARSVGGMFGVMRCLRNLIGMLALVADCLCLLYLHYLVPARFSVWLRTRHVGLLAGDTALRDRRARRKRNCYCQSGSQNFLHGLSPEPYCFV